MTVKVFLNHNVREYFLRQEKIGAYQKIVFIASQIWEMACAK